MAAPTNDLETFARTGDEDAFRALVDAHLGMVFGTAMRRLGDRGLSEEIAQNVFRSLAQKAGAIRSAGALPAWLHRATVLECSKAIRGESRRRQRMEKLIEITAIEGEGLAVWKHAQHDLDEAVDELPAKDREVLFQRFYEERSFREIAQTSGKSVAAAQKQASRALDKLGELMRARGFAIPATVLAAGLGVEFGKAAPAKLATTVTSAALSGATATTTSINILGIMSTTKSTAAGAAVAIALIAAFTGGAYLKGRSATLAKNEAEQAALLAQSEANVGDGDRSMASPTATNANNKAGRRGSVREILQAAADHFANHLNNRADTTEDAEREIAKLRPEEIEAALDELAMLDIDDETRERTRWAIVKHWARSDGPAAANYALARAGDDRFHHGTTAALYSWAEHAPAKAYAWYQEHIAASQLGADLKKSALQTVIKSWAANDPVAALGEFAKLPYDNQRNLVRSLDSLAKTEETRVPYLEALNDYPDEPMRVALIGAAVEDWSRIDPPAAAAWWDTLQFEEPMQALGHAFELGENWFEHDPPAGVNWMWDKLPKGMQVEFITDVVKRHWAETDPEGAAAWLKEKGIE